LSSFDFNEIRKDLKMAEERVERLRQELKEIQKNRDESFIKTPPPSYIPPSIINPNLDFLNHNLPASINRGYFDRSTSPLVQEVKEFKLKIFFSINSFFFKALINTTTKSKTNFIFTSIT
jgi:hypothetical protein